MGGASMRAMTREERIEERLRAVKARYGAKVRAGRSKKGRSTVRDESWKYETKEERMRVAWQMYVDNYNYAAIAKHLATPKTTVRRWIAKKIESQKEDK